MKASELHDFIHKLSPEEKKVVDRDFKHTGYDQNNSYRRFCNYLASRTEAFDEHEFQAFAAETGLKPNVIRTYCGRTYRRIGVLLLELHQKADLIYLIQQHIALAKLFIKKERYDLARKELNAAKTKEAEIVHPASRFDIQTLLTHILFLENHKNIDKPLSKHHEVARAAARNIQRDGTIYLGYQELYRHGMRRQGSEADWDRLAQTFDGIELPTDVNLEIRLFYISVKMRIAHHRRALKEVHKWAEMLYQFFIDNPSYRTDHKRLYLTAFDHYLAALSLQARQSEIPQILEELQAVEVISALERTKKVGTYLFYHLNVLVNDTKARKTLSERQLEELKDVFQKSGEAINPSRLVSIRLMFAILYFLRLDYANTEIFLNDIPVKKGNKVRTDIQRNADMMRLSILVDDELHKFDYVQSTINSTRVRLHSWNGLKEYEVIALHHFTKLNGERHGTREYKAQEQAFLVELQEYQKKENGHAEAGAAILSEWLRMK